MSRGMGAAVEIGRRGSRYGAQTDTLFYDFTSSGWGGRGLSGIPQTDDGRLSCR